MVTRQVKVAGFGMGGRKVWVGEMYGVGRCVEWEHVRGLEMVGEEAREGVTGRATQPGAGGPSQPISAGGPSAAGVPPLAPGPCLGLRGCGPKEGVAPSLVLLSRRCSTKGLMGQEVTLIVPAGRRAPPRSPEDGRAAVFK